MERISRRQLFTAVAFSLGLIAAVARPGLAQIRIINPYPIPITWPNLFANNLVEITAGFAQTCVRKGDGTVHCWGLDDSGQVGVASTVSCMWSQIQDPNHISVGPPMYSPCVDRPQTVPLPAATQVVAGSSHTCALTSGGVASCWGAGEDGELGWDGFMNSIAPQPMVGYQFSSLGAGDRMTCGLMSTGMYCWGVLPLNPTIYGTSRPYQLTSYAGFHTVTVGSWFACGVFVSGTYGENDCQGIDSRGQLGIPQNSLPQDSYYGTTFPYAPILWGTSFGMFFDPTTMTYSKHVARSSAGYQFMCADITNGTVQCAGANDVGQLGNHGTSDSATATTVSTANGMTAFHGVTAGAQHACALDANGYAWCWGSGQYGELGNGISGFGAHSSFPQQVSTTITFVALAAGGQHTCGIGTDNYIYCWGDNEFGQLGVGYDNLGWTSFLPTTYTATPQKLGSI